MRLHRNRTSDGLQVVRSSRGRGAHLESSVATRVTRGAGNWRGRQINSAVSRSSLHSRSHQHPSGFALRALGFSFEKNLRALAQVRHAVTSIPFQLLPTALEVKR